MATVVSTVAGAAGMLLVHQVVRAFAGRFTALATVVVLSFSMASPVFQIAYTESLSLVLVAGTLLAVIRGRYAVAAVLVLLLSFTRPMTPPLALAVGVWALLRRRDGQGDWAGCSPWPSGPPCAPSGGRWSRRSSPAVPRAYVESQAAWDNRPLASLTDLLRWTGRWELVVLLLSLATVLLAALPATGRQWHPLLRWWLVVYPVYLLARTRRRPRGCVICCWRSRCSGRYRGRSSSGWRRRTGTGRRSFWVSWSSDALSLQWYWVSRGLVVGPGWRFTP